MTQLSTIVGTSVEKPSMPHPPMQPGSRSIAPAGYDTLTREMPFLGRVTSSHATLEAGSWQEIAVNIEIGASGLADGATLKATFKFYSDWALFQTIDPHAANYVTA